MRRVIGFAMFFLAAGMILGYLLSGFMEFLIITIFILLAYILFCRDC
jgi:hypothetical protein